MIAISGGMVASFALPASAATSTIKVKTPTPASNALAVAAPSAAQAPLVSPAFGDIGFSGVDKPKPAPVRTTERASRSQVRVPVTTRAPVNRSGGVLGIAASFAGTPYLYGGTTPSGFDCSGYSQYVFAQMGINLPRTAEAQRQATTSVSNPAPGDLVFFGAPAYHMGIYAGDGKMWDAPRAGKSVSLRSIWTTSGVTYGRV